MPEFTVIIEAEYAEEAPSPKEAIRQILDRSDHPDKLTVRVI